MPAMTQINPFSIRLLTTPEATAKLEISQKAERELIPDLGAKVFKFGRPARLPGSEFKAVPAVKRYVRAIRAD